MKIGLKNLLFYLTLVYFMLTGGSVQAWITPIGTEITEDTGEMAIISHADAYFGFACDNGHAYFYTHELNYYFQLNGYADECGYLYRTILNQEISQGQFIHLVPLDSTEIDVINACAYEIENNLSSYHHLWIDGKVRFHVNDLYWVVLDPQSSDSKMTMVAFRHPHIGPPIMKRGSGM